MKKVLIYITNSFDVKFAQKYIKLYNNKKDITIIATSVEARLCADMNGLKYKSYEHFFHFKIDRKNLLKKSMDYAYKILDNKKSILYDTNISVSLVELNFKEISSILYELLCSYELISNIVESEHPDLILIPYRKNILLQKGVYWLLQGTNGTETEMFQEVALNKNIKCKTYYVLKDKIFYNKSFYKFVKFLRYPKRSINFNFKKPSKIKRHANLSNKLIYEKTVMFYVWGEYYFKQNIATIEYLLKNKINLVLVIVGCDDISEDDFVKLKAYNTLNIIYQDEIGTDIKISPLKLCFKDVYNEIRSIVNDNQVCAKLLSYSVYTLMFKQDEVRKNWLKNEALITEYKPSVLYSHFNYLSDIFPYRKAGIPTITGCHGFYTYLDSPREIIASEYYAVQGSLFEKYYSDYYTNQKDKLVCVGEERYSEIYKTQYEMNNYKSEYNIPLDMPVCIFCDNSSFKTPPFHDRHITYNFLKIAEQLARDLPDVCVYFRVHHGLNYSYFLEYFDYINLPNFRLSISPKPEFSELVKCADVTVSHYSSAIVESLMSGIPVIYYTEHFDCCQDFLGVSNIYESHTYSDLKSKLNNILSNKKDYNVVRKEVMQFAKKAFSESPDFNGSKVLSDYILSLTDKKSVKGWDDYLERIFKTAYTYNDFVEQYYTSKPIKAKNLLNEISEENK